HPRLLEKPLDHRVGRLPNAQCAREKNRRLQLAELAHLRDAGDLSESVADVDGGGHTICEDVATVWKDRGHAGVNAISLDNRCLADTNSRDIADGVQRAGSEDARLHAEIARADALRGGRGGTESHDEKRECDGTHSRISGVGVQRASLRMTVRHRERISNTR